MSKKIYVCLLRLYPPAFRQAYGEEALRLFQDRLRDEQGLLSRLRLWLDLLLDLGTSLPAEHRRAKSAGLLQSQSVPGTPSFCVIPEKSLSAGALFFGAVVSLAILMAFPGVISRFGNTRLSGQWIMRSVISDDDSSTREAGVGSEANVRQDASRAGTTLAAPMRKLRRIGFLDRMKAPGRESNALATSHRLESQQFPAQFVPLTVTPASQGETTLDDAARKRILLQVVTNLKQHYIDPDVGQKMADSLLLHEKNGGDDAATDGAKLAGLLTAQMREVSGDRHLVVIYSPDVLPEPRQDLQSGPSAFYRREMQRTNCTFEKTEILDHNIGYLKLNSFPQTSVCADTAEAAMARLNNADAIIVDLRDNRGGFADMVQFLGAYFFDHPEYFYNPRESPTEHSWTNSPVPGSKLADKPVYLLTSATTISAAEQFTYNLKMLRRVTVVGATTAGQAHAGTFHRLDDHFGLAITEVRSINPYSKSDWEGAGIEPDVRVGPANALETARKLVERRLKK